MLGIRLIKEKKSPVEQASSLSQSSIK